MLGGGSGSAHAARNRLRSTVRLDGPDTKVLAGSLTILAALCAYRFYDFWTTGFFVSDEYGYFFDAVHGSIYSDRWFFGWMNIYIFKALGITNVDAFSFLLPFYMFFWTGLTLFVFYKMLKLLGFDRVTVAVSLLSSFMLVSFVLLSLGFLTEPVGLCFAMLGIYLLLRFLKSKSAREHFAFPILAVLSFGAASGTREPYEAFLIGGVVIVALIAFSHRKENIRASRAGSRAVLLLSVLFFALGSVFFLTVPTQAYSQQVQPLSTQLAESFVTQPTTAPPAATTTVVTFTFSNTTVISNTTITRTATSTTTSTVLPAVPFYRQSLLLNTLLIFSGGILLGWGPICFVVALCGFFILLRRSLRGGDVTPRFMFLTAVTALGSYFVVSFIFAPDPSYFSFQDYSTIIRFSDTALPAYFVAAPYFVVMLSKSRRRLAGLGAVCVIFLLIAVPIYEGYASSNFNEVTQNPFQLGYRSDAVTLRNYFAANVGGQALNLVGVPYGWTFTPGVQDIRDLHAYATGPDQTVPELLWANFTSMKWQVFYIYANPPPYDFPPNSQFLVQFLNSTSASRATPSSPFTILGTQPVLSGSDFTLYKVQLQWQ